MNADFGHRDGPSPLNCYRQGLGESGARGVPLSRRAELASDAFVAGGIVRLMNSIINKREIVEATNLSLIDDGIQLVKQLEKGDIYLDQRRAHLIQQPESADTVKHIRASGTSNVRERSQEASSLLTRIKNILAQDSPTNLAELDLEEVESTRAFFRAVHTSIIDQLEASEIPSQCATRQR
jgi:hypothetical protein